MKVESSRSRLFSCLSVLCAIAISGVLTGCATPYLDKATPEVPVSQYRKPVNPQPVQVVFEFQTKGAPNGAATKHLKDQVVTQVKESGLFSTVSEEASVGSALLSVTLNNVPVTSESDAMSKGFLTGFTFGLAGSQVTDGYICTVKYLSTNGQEPIVKSARHAIHTTIGNTSTPKGADKMENFDVAARTMTRQIVSQGLNELSLDPNFK